MRLNVALARAGVASRRQADRLIAEGQIWVDGRPASLGSRISGPVRVERLAASGRRTRVDLSALGRPGKLWLYHKVRGKVAVGSGKEDLVFFGFVLLLRMKTAFFDSSSHQSTASLPGCSCRTAIRRAGCASCPTFSAIWIATISCPWDVSI